LPEAQNGFVEEQGQISSSDHIIGDSKTPQNIMIKLPSTLAGQKWFNSRKHTLKTSC